MSYLAGFKVSGLAGRSEPFEIELNRDVNIFFGLNGSGKTSLLKILDSAFNNVSTSIKLVPFDSAEVVIYSEDHQSTLTRRIQKHSEGDVIAVGDEFEGLFSSSEIEYAQDYTRQQPDFEWKTITSIKDTASPYKHIFLPASRSFSGSTRVPSRLPAAQRRAQEEAENEWDVIFASMLDQLWTRYSNELLSEVRNIQTRGLTNILKGVLTGSAKAKISKSNVRFNCRQSIRQRINFSSSARGRRCVGE